eukprot:CAMPEP_0119197472 /NCGR_PEP_ID=MMETSP1316-20130426/14323_1 /TAXON_ID=41880 /ORGANISM="Pycnococcus provasolii, Strain RCC2336" /LENGTH=220 /DNA_ID=CAMNT_0007193291 /DNA_START=251 /DNA_END=915 /DNA_ORIENTATION=-
MTDSIQVRRAHRRTPLVARPAPPAAARVPSTHAADLHRRRQHHGSSVADGVLHLPVEGATVPWLRAWAQRRAVAQPRWQGPSPPPAPRVASPRVPRRAAPPPRVRASAPLPPAPPPPSPSLSRPRSSSRRSRRCSSPHCRMGKLRIAATARQTAAPSLQEARRADRLLAALAVVRGWEPVPAYEALFERALRVLFLGGLEARREAPAQNQALQLSFVDIL